jgi:pilus assembly protein Flp/PilA
MRNTMTPFVQALRCFARDERGATAIEYAIIAGSLSIVIVAAVANIGTTLNTTFTSVKNGFPS